MRTPTLFGFLGLLFCVAGVTGCTETYKVVVYNHAPVAKTVEFFDSAKGYFPPKTLAPNQHTEFTVKADKKALPVTCNIKVEGLPEKQFAIDKNTKGGVSLHIEETQLVGPLAKDAKFMSSSRTQGQTTHDKEIIKGDGSTPPPNNGGNNGGMNEPAPEEVVE